MTLFSKYGIKTISMDHIAQNLRVSKRTIYEIFTDKNDLLKQCLRNESEAVQRVLETTEKGSESFIEVIAFFVHIVPPFLRMALRRVCFLPALIMKLYIICLIISLKKQRTRMRSIWYLQKNFVTHLPPFSALCVLSQRC